MEIELESKIEGLLFYKGEDVEVKKLAELLNVGVEEIEEGSICPWCIADGKAHEQFGAKFTDIYEDKTWKKVPRTIKEEILFRTPGFAGWQQEHWWAHCDKASIFLDRVAVTDKTIRLIDQLEEGLKLQGKWTDYFKHVNKETSPTIYLFQCQKCKKFGGYSDCD